MIDSKPTNECVYCRLNLKPVKLRRQYVHYIERKMIVCEELSYPYRREHGRRKETDT